MPKTITISDETWNKIKDQVKEEDKPEKKTVKIYNKGGSVLKEIDGDTLSGADLHGANLREANLRGADLCWADLCETDLCLADLREANLSDANLREADLSGANLREANLSGANLGGAKFCGQTSIPKILKQSQVKDFLLALGFEIEE